jgi:glycosyltransferase involved in cell wall biosynthesis
MISILIPIYNTPIRFLNECFDSIENQTFKEYEVIIVNDGSNKETSDFLSTLNNRYQIFHKDKSGISEALNFGIERCNYNIVARMDGDDIMLPNRLQKQYQYLKENDIDILGSQMELFGMQNGITKHTLEIPRDIMVRSDWFMNHPTIMFKKDLIVNLGGYNSDFDGLEDLELWCRALWKRYTLKNLPDILVKHRRHNDNATVKNDIGVVMQKIESVRRYYINKIYNI